jgi:hypothetical protein
MMAQKVTFYSIACFAGQTSTFEGGNSKMADAGVV